MKTKSLSVAALALVASWTLVPGLAEAGDRHRKPHGSKPSPTWVRPAPVRPCPPPWTPAHLHGPYRGHDLRHPYPSNTVVYRSYTAYAGPVYGGGTWGSRELLGNLIGGTVGGVVGAQVGKGSGRTAAIVGGTVVGVLVGGSVGRSMDAVDRLYVNQVLETAPTRTAVAWHNPDTSTRYEVTPIATFQEAGRYCREYTATALIGGRSQQIYGTACRQPDGSWEVVR